MGFDPLALRARANHLARLFNASNLTLFCGWIANESNLAEIARLASEIKFCFAESAVKFSSPKTTLNLSRSKITHYKI